MKRIILIIIAILLSCNNKQTPTPAEIAYNEIARYSLSIQHTQADSNYVTYVVYFDDDTLFTGRTEKYNEKAIHWLYMSFEEMKYREAYARAIKKEDQ